MFFVCALIHLTNLILRNWEVVFISSIVFLEESLSDKFSCGNFSPEPDCSLLFCFIFMIGINMGHVSVFSPFRLLGDTLLLFNKIPSHWHAYSNIHLFLLSVLQWVWQLVLNQNQKQFPPKIQIPLKCLKSWKFPRKNDWLLRSIVKIRQSSI